MKMSPQGLVFLMQREGIVLPSYKDSVGVWTIGVGHTAAADAGVKPGPGVRLRSVREAMDLFTRDIVKYERDVTRVIKVTVAQHEFDALTSFHYNTGAISKANLTKHLNKGNRAAAAAAFMGYVKPPEITGRRKLEQRLFETGDYGDLRQVLVYTEYPGTKSLVDASALIGAGAIIVSPAPVAEPDLGPMSGKVNTTTMMVQRALKSFGYFEIGNEDGKYGAKTAGAITSFKLDRAEDGLPVIDDALLNELKEAAAEIPRFTRPVAPERALATIETVAAKVPEVAAAQSSNRTGFWTFVGTGASAVTGAVVKNAGDAVEWLTPIKTFAGDLPAEVWFGAVGVAALLIGLASWQAGKAVQAGTEAFKTGERS